MAPAPARSAGLFGSLRRLAATAIELAQVRLELLSTEIEQEKLRLFDALLWTGAALVMLATGVVLLCVLLVVLMWDSHRLLTLVVLTAAFLGGGAWALLAARQRLHSPGRLFEASLGELRRDRGALGSMPGDSSHVSAAGTASADEVR